MSKLIYLASPYSSPSPAVQEKRFQHACDAAAHFIREGRFVFSPIAHTHPISSWGLPGDWKFWSEFDRMMIERCDELWVLRLPGWGRSVGVAAEVKTASELAMVVRYIGWPIAPSSLPPVQG